MEHQVGRSVISVRLQQSCIDLQFNIVNIHLMLVIHMDVIMLLKSRMFRYIECHMVNIMLGENFLMLPLIISNLDI